jgi:hypothetical protein
MVSSGFGGIHLQPMYLRGWSRRIPWTWGQTRQHKWDSNSKKKKDDLVLAYDSGTFQLKHCSKALIWINSVLCQEIIINCGFLFWIIFFKYIFINFKFISNQTKLECFLLQVCWGPSANGWGSQVSISSLHMGPLPQYFTYSLPVHMADLHGLCWVCYTKTHKDSYLNVKRFRFQSFCPSLVDI